LKNLLNYLPDSAIVVPLDADEFLSQRTIKNLHTVLKENPDINVRIPWRNAYPKTYKSIVDNINRSTPLKIAIQLSSSFKVSSTVGHIRRRNLRFSQGGHFLIRPNGYFADSESSDELEILHMPLRSLEQYNNKITKGINAYDAKNKLGIFQRRLGLHWLALRNIPEDIRELLFPIIIKKYGSVETFKLMILLNKEDIRKFTYINFTDQTFSDYLQNN
jgi:hypothetical protein